VWASPDHLDALTGLGSSAKEPVNVNDDRASLFTPRLELRHAIETDREEIVKLYRDPEFTVYSSKKQLDPAEADQLFEKLLDPPPELRPFAERPVIARATNAIIGLVGADQFHLDKYHGVQFSYRFVAGARKQGHATEASEVMLALWAETVGGEMFAQIRNDNDNSKRLARKLGFHCVDEIINVDYRSWGIYRIRSAAVLRLCDLYVPPLWSISG
jgi:RimJ/RimL family protein N-acetyltransferase